MRCSRATSTATTPDIATAGVGGIFTLVGLGDGTFEPAQKLAAPAGLRSVAGDDVDLDGSTDLVLAGGANKVFVGLNDGQGTFAEFAPYTVGGTPAHVAIADVDDDGTFRAQSRVKVGGTPTALSVGDLDENARNDLVTANRRSRSITVLLSGVDAPQPVVCLAPRVVRRTLRAAKRIVRHAKCSVGSVPPGAGHRGEARRRAARADGHAGLPARQPGPETVASSASLAFIVEPEIEKYAEEHTSPDGELFERLAEETRAKTTAPQMMVGRIEGQFLATLVRLRGAQRILELGTFTGYSSISMASALPPGGSIISCDVDPEATAIARRYMDESGYGDRIEIRLGPALETIETLEGPFDLVFIDADKPNYKAYYEAVAATSGRERPRHRGQRPLVGARGRRRRRGVDACDQGLQRARQERPESGLGHAQRP